MTDKPKQHPQSKEEPKPPEMEFEATPRPYGWFPVVFPLVNDVNTHLESWLAGVHDWIRMRGFRDFTFSFLHTTNAKKVGDHVRPIFYFRSMDEAARCGWRFKGDLLK